jgi:hypothetical protein
MNTLEQLKQQEMDLAEDIPVVGSSERTVVNLRLCKRQLISLVAEQLLAPEKVLYLLGLHMNIY